MATTTTNLISFLLFPLLLLLHPSTISTTTLPILHPFSPSSPHHHHLPLTPTSISILSSTTPSPSRRHLLHHSWAPIASGATVLSTPSYLVHAALGSPPQSLLLSLRTSYRTSWIPTSSFHPSKSSTFSSSPHTPLHLRYGSTTFHASLSKDTLRIAADNHPSFSFALVTSATGSPSSSSTFPPQGLLGLGRGPNSFLSQTHRSYHSIFSYCLPSYRSANFSGTLRLGPKGQPVHIKKTQLLQNPHRPSLFYVPMTAIRVGSRFLNIPHSAFAFDPKSGAGTIIDTGTLFTRLVSPAYEALRDEFRRRVGKSRRPKSLGGFDTCYDGIVEKDLPTVSFHFEGDIFVTLPKENVVIRSSAGSTVCLAMAASPSGGVDRNVNTISGWQQQNHRVLIDASNGKVGFSREQCTP